MSYTPLVRWRNFTLENLKTILNVYPDMTSDLPRSKAVDIIEQRLGGYKKTAYQFACQLGLECRGDRFEIQNYLFSFDDYNLIRYLSFWFKMYVTPNPYVNSNEEPICIFKSLAEEILGSENKQISFNDFCIKYFGSGKSSDILKNTIQAYGNPIKVRNDTVYLTEDKIDELNLILAKVNDTLPMTNTKDEREFFNRFSYEQFCKYYGISYSPNLLDNLKDNLILETSDIYTIGDEDRIKGGTNILLYGVPGAGKSHTIKTKYCNDPLYMERVVFHPDYTYSDFVGQILPKVSEERITYEFTPGPFTKILKKAENSPRTEYYLIIEEINRGNAPAIFGEVFQLLDRDESGKSEYGISNADVAKIVYCDESHLVSLPSNLYILATMNTSDQNVFTLDTAFQRRWRMKMIENDVNSADHGNNEILDTGIKWKTFNIIINNQILQSSVGVSSAEDKRLGVYFVGAEDLKLREDGDNSRFPEKVLKYLWDDAFKFSRSSVFMDEYRSLEEIVKKFNTSTGIERFNIFKSEIVDLLSSQGQ